MFRFYHAFEFSFEEKNNNEEKLILKNSGTVIMDEDENDFGKLIPSIALVIFILSFIVLSIAAYTRGLEPVGHICALIMLICLLVAGIFNGPPDWDGYAKEKSYNQFPQITNLIFFKRHPVLMRLLSKL
jgi:hypothetical protein